ncbi:MAG: hypothetical protein IKY75_00500 [Bacteroidaceae bacterium]|nr:hypothetical protein [Bacteroidaceae bacterium]
MKISIDKLKVCYKFTEQSPIHYLMENPIEEFEMPSWYFHLVRTDGKHFEHIYRIIYLERTANNNQEYDYQCFGTLRWGLRSDKTGEMSDFVWIEIDNKQLYLNYNYNTSNRVVYLEHIEDMLGLQFHNLTRLDLAIDDTRNLSKRLIRAIRDENLIPIVNGTKVTDRNKLLEDILYIGVGSCRRIKEYNLIVQQKNGDLRLSAYNKKREIESKSGKQYITEANGNPQYLFRLEVRINGDVLREYFDKNRIEYNSIMFCDEAWLCRLFLAFSSRVLRFQTVKGRQSLDVLDIVA